MPIKCTPPRPPPPPPLGWKHRKSNLLWKSILERLSRGRSKAYIPLQRKTTFANLFASPISCFCVDLICVWWPTQTQFPVEYGLKTIRKKWAALEQNPLEATRGRGGGRGGGGSHRREDIRKSELLWSIRLMICLFGVVVERLARFSELFPDCLKVNLFSYLCSHSCSVRN